MGISRRIDLRLLGGFGVECAGSAANPLRISARKGRGLLAYLAMHSEHRASREQLADLLWGDRFDAQARQSLRQCLLSLRRDLEPAGTGLLVFDGETVSLRVEWFSTDALRFASLALSSAPSDRQRAIELYRGEFLKGLSVNVEAFEQWARGERVRLASLAASVLAEAAQLWDRAGGGAQAVASAERLVQLDGLCEDSQRLLLRLYARHRGRDTAMAHAKTVTALLRVELSADPEAATSALIEDIRRGAVARVEEPRANGLHPAANRRSGESPGHWHNSADPPNPVNTDAATSDGASLSDPGRWSWRQIAAPKAVATLASLALVSAFAASLWLGSGTSTAVPSVGDRTLHAYAPATKSWRSPPNARDAAADKETLADKGLYAIAVLPFTSDAGDSSRERMLADQLTDDLINDLSRIATLRVIAGPTMRLYREKTIDVATVGAELGVHYVVEGSVRMQDTTARINVALVDVTSRLQVWSDRFERVEAERFAVLDEIARGLARRLQLGMAFHQSGRAERRGSSDLATEELLAKGWGIVFGNHTLGNAKGADVLFKLALERQPDNLSAMIGLAAYNIAAVTNLEVAEREPSLGISEDLLRRVLEKRPHVSTAHYFHGLLLRVRGQLQPALEAYTRALDHNPSLATAYAGAGHVLTRLGRAEEALVRVRYAMRLSPKDPQLGMWSVYAGLAELSLGREDAALEWLGRAAMLSPRTPFVHAALASAHALKGDRAAARRHVAELKRLAPLFTEAKLLEWYAGPATVHAPASRFIEGLHLALKSPS